MDTAPTVVLDRPNVLLIEEEVRHLLGVMSISDARTSSAIEASGRVTVTIEAADAGRSLIGPQGTTIDALEHIVRALIRRRLHASFPITLDVNQYRAHRQHQYVEVAQAAAQTAERTGRPQVLPPMSAADRRAVHTDLASHPGIRTESIGEGESRRVVVRPSLIA